MADRPGFVLALLAGLAACAPPIDAVDDRVVIRTGADTAQPLPGDREVRDVPAPLTDGSTNLLVASGLNLVWESTVPSPVFDDVVLQATDVVIRDQRAYATYNVRGDTFHGAIQIIDISDIATPVVLAEAIYPQTDIARLVVSGQRIFASAADVDYGATLESFTLDGDVLTWDGSEDLPSFSGTYVDLEAHDLVVSYGDVDGGVDVFSVVDGEPAWQSSVAAPDARWVDPMLDDLVVVTGSPSELSIVEDGLLGGSTRASVPVIGGTVGAPTWASRSEDLLYLSADQAGIQIGDLDDQTLVGQTPTNGDANGSVLALDRNLAFLANGEAGLAVVDVSEPLAPVTLANFDVPGDAGSANAVAVDAHRLALADGLAGVKLFTFERVVVAPPDDCDNDGIPNDLDPDDDNDGVLDIHDAEACDPDLVCEDGSGLLHLEARFVADFYNLPCDHPDVGGRITGWVTGNHPDMYDWWDDPYYSFTIDRPELQIDYDQDYFPVDEGLCDEPFYFAAHWSTTAIASHSGWYHFEMGSDDDSWLIIDDQVVIDLGGIHALVMQNGAIYLEEGAHQLDVYFAERHVVQSGLIFNVAEVPPGASLDMIQHLCVDPQGDEDGDGVPNIDDVAPLRRPEDG